MTACVYALVNPIDNKVFYVGKTRRNNVYDRLKEHIENALNYNGNKLKNSLIRTVLNSGLKVKLLILEYVHKGQLSKIENIWIRIYQKLNRSLTNFGRTESKVNKPEVVKIDEKPIELDYIYPYDLIGAKKLLQEATDLVSKYPNEKSFGGSMSRVYEYILKITIERYENATIQT